MEFDGSFGPAEFGPVKKGDGKINSGRIEAPQGTFESKLLSSSHLAPAPLQHPQKDLLIELPGAVFVGISQGGPTWRADPQVLQFPFAASEASGYFPERMGSSELAK